MILVIDVGTSSVRAAVVDPDGSVRHLEQRAFAPLTPAPGLVEFDPAVLADMVLEMSEAAISAVGSVTCVGITAQRASAVLWDRVTGRPLGPGLGWQDLRTLGECLVAKAEHGLSIAPNQSATKFAWLAAQHSTGMGEPLVPDRTCAGTVDAWLVWTLSEGTAFVTDHTHAGVTGLYDIASGEWSERLCGILHVDPHWLPRIVDSSGAVAMATRLKGSPPITAVVGDQQSSLIGQGCIYPGMAKITFGTGGMLDMCRGDLPPIGGYRSPEGTFPIVAWSEGGQRVWGEEAIMLSAGTNVEWLVEDMGLIDSASHSEQVAASVPDSGGLVYVPALLGLGTPTWDYGARGMLIGLTRGSTRAHVVRAVLEGVAHRGVDLLAATEKATGIDVPVLRIDGGMSRNRVFAQALANAADRPVEVSLLSESTLLGAAFLAGSAHGVWRDLAEATETWQPLIRLEPTEQLDRELWLRASQRAAGWIPELSALDF
jgi:glycerol kinase